ncbi:uncharacterized protein [Nicotiana tomentosiformis]|uniref:uncharacterized protein n=1 Tax=Nicotiana tomentosiformis TaxID=4098 RepID=UPI00388C736E
MVRTQAAVANNVIPRVDVARGRGRGRRGARAITRAPTRAAVEEPPVVPVWGQVPKAPAVTPRHQETLAHILSMFGTLAQAGLIQVAPATSQTGAATSEEEQLRLARFKKYDPPTFIVLALEGAQYFLEECHRILCTMGIVEMSGVAFTTFQLKGAAYQWWRAYEFGSPVELASLTWVQFSEMFLREFSDMARYAPPLVAKVRERVRRFIEGLRHDMWFSMARELESNVSFQQSSSFCAS